LNGTLPPIADSFEAFLRWYFEVYVGIVACSDARASGFSPEGNGEWRLQWAVLLRDEPGGSF